MFFSWQSVGCSFRNSTLFVLLSKLAVTREEGGENIKHGSCSCRKRSAINENYNSKSDQDVIFVAYITDLLCVLRMYRPLFVSKMRVHSGKYVFQHKRQQKTLVNTFRLESQRMH